MSIIRDSIVVITVIRHIAIIRVVSSTITTKLIIIKWDKMWVGMRHMIIFRHQPKHGT